ncbi:MAG: nucleotidyltransferase domain-containing protein, partial [Methanobacteriota archaeon]
RDIRKKFEFIKEISHHTFDLRLKKGSVIKEIIEDVKEEILNHKFKKRIKEIILYGSSVENQRTFRSDVDIAVVFEEINLREATEFRVRISGRSSDLVDVQVYNVLPEKIKKTSKWNEATDFTILF